MAHPLQYKWSFFVPCPCSTCQGQVTARYKKMFQSRHTRHFVPPEVRQVWENDDQHVYHRTQEIAVFDDKGTCYCEASEVKSGENTPTDSCPLVCVRVHDLCFPPHIRTRFVLDVDVPLKRRHEHLRKHCSRRRAVKGGSPMHRESPTIK